MQLSLELTGFISYKAYSACLSRLQLNLFVITMQMELLRLIRYYIDRHLITFGYFKGRPPLGNLTVRQLEVKDLLMSLTTGRLIGCHFSR